MITLVFGLLLLPYCEGLLSVADRLAQRLLSHTDVHTQGNTDANTPHSH